MNIGEVYLYYGAEWLILVSFANRVRSLTWRTVVSSVVSVVAVRCHREVAVIQYWDLNSPTWKGQHFCHLICNMSIRAVVINSLVSMLVKAFDFMLLTFQTSECKLAAGFMNICSVHLFGFHYLSTYSGNT